MYAFLLIYELSMHGQNNERRKQKSMHNTEVHRSDIGVRLAEYLQMTFNTSNNF